MSILWTIVVVGLVLYGAREFWRCWTERPKVVYDNKAKKWRPQRGRQLAPLEQRTHRSPKG